MEKAAKVKLEAAKAKMKADWCEECGDRIHLRDDYDEEDDNDKSDLYDDSYDRDCFVCIGCDWYICFDCSKGACDNCEKLICQGCLYQYDDSDWQHQGVFHRCC